jgi:hypothetical protein
VLRDRDAEESVSDALEVIVDSKTIRVETSRAVLSKNYPRLVDLALGYWPGDPRPIAVRKLLIAYVYEALDGLAEDADMLQFYGLGWE